MGVDIELNPIGVAEGGDKPKPNLKEIENGILVDSGAAVSVANGEKVFANYALQESAGSKGASTSWGQDWLPFGYEADRCATHRHSERRKWGSFLVAHGMSNPHRKRSCSPTFVRIFSAWSPC